MTEGTPFRKPLQSLDKRETANSRLSEFEDDPRFIVRGTSLETINDIESTTVQFKSLPEAAVEIKNLFDELKSYGMNVSVHHVIGKNTFNQEVLFSIADRVQPIEYSSADEVTKQAIVDAYIANDNAIIRYYTDKVRSKQYCLSDLVGMHDQFVYGVTADNPHPQLYLVDVDPWIADAGHSGIWIVIGSKLKFMKGRIRHSEIGKAYDEAEREHLYSSIDELRRAIGDTD